ncbi:MAG: penicillin-binding protein 1C [Treponema sp.]|jgi:penicillin-binding protein 1C|nr:penicillin-binding protein 1C [Treponema sp.]
MLTEASIKKLLKRLTQTFNIKLLKKNYRLIFILAVFLVLILLFVSSLPKPLFDVYYSPVVYDREGKFLGAQVAHDGQWRFPGTEKLNDKFVTALLEAEDRRFRRHLGVDPAAVARALVQNIRAKRVISGGSTITMQTIRLSRGLRKRTILEKGIEAVLALRLEIGYSKNEILALYAANAPFGANVVGLEAASWRWFGRSCEDLSWAEAATLAALPNSPALIHPGRNREMLKIKRDALLAKLNNRGFIDNETLFLSIAEPLPGEPLPLPRLAPHLLDRLVLETGGAAAFKKQAAFTTTIERDIQERAAAILNRASARFMENGIMNGACLIINTLTGETAAYVGNTMTPHAPDVDIITSWRSSGSLLKPFLYAAMLDAGDILPSSIVSDIPTRVGSFSPENITRTYLGVVPADEALARSLNVPAARALRSYGVDRFTQQLRSLGMTTLFRTGSEYGLPLVLGGAETTLWEITGIYAGLGRAVHAREGDGTLAFFPPSVYSREEKEASVFRGRRVAFRASTPAQQLISPGAAWLTLETLVSGVRPGDEAIWQEYAGARRIAWKTGTSFGFRDAWAIGVTPEWTVGVWIGNASGEGRAELRSAVTAAPVLFELFSVLDSMGGNRGAWFYQPAVELRHAEVCASSGYPSGAHCAAVKIAELPRHAPALRACPFCRTIVLNENLDRRITLSSGASVVTVERKWFVLPPAEEWYFRRWNLDYKPLPPDDVMGGGGEAALALFNPEPDGQIYVPRELDGSEGRIVFSAAHRDETSVIFWHLDGDYLGSTLNFHEMEARPQPGLRTLVLVDENGNTLIRQFTVLNPYESLL